MDNTLKLFCPGRGKNNSEDALPIIDEKFLLVADGLGGSGGFAHSSVSDGVKNGTTFYDTLFGKNDLISQDNIKLFHDYVMNSFQLYNALSLEEKTSRTCDFRSGYFASRFVASILYSYFLSKDDSYFTEIFERFQYTGSDCEKLSADFSAEIKSIVKNGLSNIAQYGNFIYESKTKGMILLPTTLVTVLYKEYDEFVDAIYLWAGDSRGYYWKDTGLKQATNDHETDGVMTNLINLSGDFNISCKYVRIPKPCVLFATSDGCYSCMTSPLDFEYYFMSAFNESSSMSDVAQKLEKFYRENSEDDTNTVALKSFGYSSFDELRQSVKGRITELFSKYDGALPGIFTENFDGVVDSCRRVLKKEISNCDSDILKEHEIMEILVAKQSGQENVLQWKNNLKLTIDSQKQRLYNIIKKNYIFILPLLPSGDFKDDKNNRKILSKHSKEIEIITDNINVYQENISEIKNSILNASNDMLNILDELLCFKLDILNDESATKCYSVFDRLLTVIDQISEDESDELKTIKKNQTKIQKASESFTDKNSAAVTYIVDALVENKIDMDTLRSLFVYDEIAECCAVISNAKLQLSGEISLDNQAEALNEFWKKNHIDILKELYITSPDSNVWQKLGSGIKNNIKTMIDNEGFLKIRTKLYQEYFESYQLN